MFRTCQATGRLRCVFDKVTHRCKCGRWERGFKPTSEPVKPRGECQICEAKFAVDANGCLGHHGYKRPGCGFIVGDCMGVAHKPYTATDALEKYREFIENAIAVRKEQLAELPNLPELTYYYEVYRSFKKPEQKTVTIKRGESVQIQTHYGSSHTSRVEFADVEIACKYRLESELQQAERELIRVSARIEKANKGKRHAFTAVVAKGEGFRIGRADEGTKGYTPQDEGTFKTYKEAMDHAKKMNEAIGLKPMEAWEIVAGTMGK